VQTALDYSAALTEQNHMLAETVFSAEAETPIPTCPGWSMRQLIRHVGRAHRWAAQIIETETDVRLDPRTVADGRPPDDADGAREWLLASPKVLLEAVADAGGAEVMVATFAGPRPARWWIRRLLHETTVHRADAALAVGEYYDLAPEISADGIDEWLGRLAERPGWGVLPVQDGKAVSLIANDDGPRWTILVRDGRLHLHRRTTASPGVQLAGPTKDLFLALLRRCDAQEIGCSVEGDHDLWATFLARTPYSAPGTE
jgi:uncharacterized protein (TIGR03083 family)